MIALQRHREILNRVIAEGSARVSLLARGWMSPRRRSVAISDCYRNKVCSLGPMAERLHLSAKTLTSIFLTSSVTDPHASKKRYRSCRDLADPAGSGDCFGPQQHRLPTYAADPRHAVDRRHQLAGGLYHARVAPGDRSHLHRRLARSRGHGFLRLAPAWSAKC